MLEWLLLRLWYVLPETRMMVTLAPSRCYSILEMGAKPSVERLHLQNVFARGRRYTLKPLTDGGFRMTTSHKVIWHPRQRTSASAVLKADLEQIDTTLTRLCLRAHIKPRYLLDVFLWPLFIGSMIIYMPWALWLRVGLFMLLLLLSWTAHRSNAMLEAQEMLFFVEKVLGDYLPQPPAHLSGAAADVVYERDFADAWEKFYGEIRDEPDNGKELQ